MMRYVWMLGLAMCLGLAGCDAYAFRSAKNSLASTDRYEFESMPYRPYTISLVETFSGRTVWSKAVPVGDVLVLDLDHHRDVELMSVSGAPATSMQWWVYGPDRNLPVDKGCKDLAGVPVKLVVELRKVPEYPPGYVAMEAEKAGAAATQPTGK